MRCDPGASISRIAADPSRADLAAVAVRRTCLFRRARTTRAAHGLGARHLPSGTPSIGRQSQFCQEPLRRGNLFGQSLRSCNTLSPIAAVRSVTSLPDCHAGLTLLPSAPFPQLLVELPRSRRVRDAHRWRCASSAASHPF